MTDSQSYPESAEAKTADFLRWADTVIAKGKTMKTDNDILDRLQEYSVYGEDAKVRIMSALAKTEIERLRDPVQSGEGLINGNYPRPIEYYQRVARNLAAVWSNGNDGARTCILVALLRAARPMPVPDEVELSDDEIISRCYEHGQPDYVRAADRIKDLKEANESWLAVHGPAPQPLGVAQTAQVIFEEPRNVTAADREYASDLLADLTSDDLPGLEIAARWFRKARVEHSLPGNHAQQQPKWRHLKRGSIVTEIARGFAQVAHHPIEEMTCVVIYRHDDDGRYWVRNAVEFDDGRFEAYPLSSTVPSPAAPDILAGLEGRLDRLLLTASDNSRFVLSTESAKNIVGIVREWIRSRGSEHTSTTCGGGK